MTVHAVWPALEDARPVLIIGSLSPESLGSLLHDAAASCGVLALGVLIHPGRTVADDLLAVASWVCDHAAELGADPGRLVVAGSSLTSHALAAAVVAIAGRHGWPKVSLGPRVRLPRPPMGAPTKGRSPVDNLIFDVRHRRVHRRHLERKENLMRKLKAWLYMTLDGVVEAPEKWVMPDAEMFEAQTAGYATSDALLLGRRTYEVFAASWSQRGSDVPNADWMNNTPKYVASTSLESPEWQHATTLKGNVDEAIARLKQQDGADITLNGSATLLRSLLAAGLVDELRILLHPVVLGSGERLFDNPNGRVDLELTGCHAYDNGVVLLTYQPTEH
jgi:dihydrofolate reductase